MDSCPRCGAGVAGPHAPCVACGARDGAAAPQIPVSSEPEPLVCDQCGATVTADARRCPNRGESFDAESAPATTELLAQYATLKSGLAQFARNYQRLQSEFAALSRQIEQLAGREEPAARTGPAPVPAPPPAAAPPPLPTAAEPRKPAATPPPLPSRTAVAPGLIPAAGGPPPVAPAAAPQPAMDLETRIGAIWFNRLGLAALAIALAFLSRYINPHLQAWHKVALGYLGAVILFCVGHWFRERLHQFARPVMAGALALAFFISFAGHFITPMACLPLPVALGLMAACTGGILLGADRWRSEGIAAFAILLGHLAASIAGGDADAFSLTIITFLCLAPLVLYLRHAWSRLALFGAVAAYASHLAWSIQVHPAVTVEKLFWINLGFLTSYYLIFLIIDLVRAVRPDRDSALVESGWTRFAGRLIGPVSLTGYTVLTAALFFTTDLYWDRIHWYLFPLAAVQVAVALVHRRRHTIDHPLYLAAAVIFATLGFFSALDGLSLNLTLAAEALLLLVLARTLNCWPLNPLAQFVLVINFVHYWASEAHHLTTWPVFLGSAVTALVYLVKSRLEETWRTRPAIGEPLTDTAFGAACRTLLEFTMAPLALIHALAGSGLLIYSCLAFFERRDDLIALTVTSLVVWFATLLARSGVLTLATLTVAGAGVVTLLVQPMTIGGYAHPPAPAHLWVTNQFALLALGMAGFLSQALARRSGRPFFFCLGTGLLLLTAPGLFFGSAGAGIPLGHLFFLALAAPLLLWYEADRGRAPIPAAIVRYSPGLLGDLEKQMNEAVPAFAALFAVLGALTVGRTIAVLAVDALHTQAMLAHLTWVILLFALWRHRAALLTGLVAHLILTCGYLLLFIHPLRPAALAGVTPESLLVWWTVYGAAGSAALLLEFGFSRRQLSYVHHSLLLMFIAMGMIPHLHDHFSPFPLWLLTIVLFWWVAERYRVELAATAAGNWPATPSVKQLTGFSPWHAGFFSLVAAGLLAGVTKRAFPAAVTVVWLLGAFSLVGYGFAIWRRSPALAAAVVVLLTGAHVHYHTRIGVTDGAVLQPWLSAALIVITIAGGIGFEWLARRPGGFRERYPRLCAAGLGYAYLLGGGLAWLVIREFALFRTGRVMLAFPAQAGVAVILLLAARRWRLTWLALLAYLFTAITVLITVIFLMAHTQGLIGPGLVLLGLLVILERLTKYQDRALLGEVDQHLAGYFRFVIVIGLFVLVLLLGYADADLKRRWTTLVWAAGGFLGMVFGFGWRDRLYRRSALVLFLCALVRAVVIDMARLETIYKLCGFAGLGVGLIAVSWLYTRYRKELERWL